MCNLWGACALPGGHGASGWGKCEAHVAPMRATCTCGGRVAHSVVRLGCAHGCREAQARWDVWCPLSSSFVAVIPQFGAPDSPINSVSAFFGLPSAPLIINGMQLVLHVRRPAPPLLLRAPGARPRRGLLGNREASCPMTGPTLCLSLQQYYACLCRFPLLCLLLCL